MRYEKNSDGEERTQCEGRGDCDHCSTSGNIVYERKSGSQESGGAAKTRGMFTSPCLDCQPHPPLLFSIPQLGDSHVFTSLGCGPGGGALHKRLRQPAADVHPEHTNTPDQHAIRSQSGSRRCAAWLGEVTDTQTPQMVPLHSCAEEKRTYYDPEEAEPRKHASKKSVNYASNNDATHTHTHARTHSREGGGGRDGRSGNVNAPIPSGGDERARRAG